MNEEQVELFDLDFIDPDFNDDMKDIRDMEGVAYPFLLLSNIEYINVLSLLYNSDKGSCRSINSWIFVDGEYHQINPIALTFNTLILMRNLGVTLTIYASNEKVDTINLKDPKVLEKYI